MDWASNDYTQVYADTFLTPAPESDTGIYLLDEADSRSDIGKAGCEGPQRRETYYTGREGSQRRETYYTGRGLGRGDEERRAIFGAAWDERPPRRQFHSLSPYAGSEWGRLMPPERPPPSTHQFITQSEGLNNPSAINLPGAFSKECFGSGSGGSGSGSSGSSSGSDTELKLQYVKVFLLIVIVVLLAMTLVSAGRLVKSLEKTMLTAVNALGTVATGGGWSHHSAAK